ncbi:hypothetical protein RB195_010239 [Necator americanus]|uniref:Uncharacterized protein n=1 Tax=Necator americanus TaxID=51031 RepID=A0ABR1D0D9_NECAM
MNDWSEVCSRIRRHIHWARYLSEAFAENPPGPSLPFPPTRTSSTSLTKVESILNNNGEGKKRVEELLGPSRPVKTGHLKVSTTSRATTFNGGRQKKGAKTLANLGLATRFNVAVGENADRPETCDNTEILLPSYDAVHIRPEMSSLPPIMLMPSVDPEVIHMQKELLLRQLRLQRMQEKVLRAQFNSLRLPIARYEEIDPDGGHVELLVEGDEEFIAERVDDEQELNVTNSGDESGDEIMRESPT